MVVMVSNRRRGQGEGQGRERGAKRAKQTNQYSEYWYAYLEQRLSDIRLCARSSHHIFETITIVLDQQGKQNKGILPPLLRHVTLSQDSGQLLAAVSQYIIPSDGTVGCCMCKVTWVLLNVSV